MYNIKLFIVRGSYNQKIGHVKYYVYCFVLEVKDYLNQEVSYATSITYRAYILIQVE
jgi:hypothetical protein